MKKKPKIGEKIYVPNSLHVYRGVDDFQGGLCTISEVKESKHLSKDHFNYYMVTIEEEPGAEYNWKNLIAQQEELKKRFGISKGKKFPDNRGEFNKPNADWH